MLSSVDSTVGALRDVDAAVGRDTSKAGRRSTRHGVVEEESSTTLVQDRSKSTLLEEVDE